MGKWGQGQGVGFDLEPGPQACQLCACLGAWSHLPDCQQVPRTFSGTTWRGGERWLRGEISWAWGLAPFPPPHLGPAPLGPLGLRVLIGCLGQREPMPASAEDSTRPRSPQGWLPRPFSEASASKRCCPTSIPREPCTLASPRAPSFSGGGCPQAFPTPGPKSHSIRGPSAGCTRPWAHPLHSWTLLASRPRAAPRRALGGGAELLGSRGPPASCAPRPHRPSQGCL